MPYPNRQKCLDTITLCSHEEADTRLFLHAREAVIIGDKTITIKTNDTDVVIIAISAFPLLQELGLESLWISFGQGSNTRWIPIHELVQSIGAERASGMLKRT
jgi:hypothetical protein